MRRMQSLPWTREQLVAGMRRDVWRYLSPASSIEEEAAQASALLRMPLNQVNALARVQFVVSREVQELLDAMPRLLRRLSSTSVAEEEEVRGRLRGRVLWGLTYGARARSGEPHVFVTAPARRSYDIPENRLVRFMLDAVASSARSTGWSRDRVGETGGLIGDRRAAAERWSSSRLLLDVASQPPSSREMARLASGRRARTYRPLLDAYTLHRSLLRRHDRDALRRSVEEGAVLVSDPAVLLELLCTFRLLDSLRSIGWEVEPFGLRRVGELRLTARKEGMNLKVYYQHMPARLRRLSAYRAIQDAHGISFPGALRPDLTLRLARPGGRPRWFFVEVKGGAVPVPVLARRAARDLLGYRRAFDRVFDDPGLAYGLGMVWGEGLRPHTSEVSLCTPEESSIQTALSMLLEEGR